MTAILAMFAFATVSLQAAQTFDPKSPIPSPTQADWLAISKLPDWSGIWVPMTKDQDAQIKTNPTPWTPKVAKYIEWQEEEAKVGRPARHKALVEETNAIVRAALEDIARKTARAARG